MPKQSVSIPGHTLEIDTSLWSGVERIRCDGQYEVNVLVSWFGSDHGYIVRRNGIILAHRP